MHSSSAKKLPTTADAAKSLETGPGFESYDFNKHLRHTHKNMPTVSFAHDTKRIFADFRHKLGVPSADTYFKNDH